MVLLEIKRQFTEMFFCRTGFVLNYAYYLRRYMFPENSVLLIHDFFPLTSKSSKTFQTIKDFSNTL